MYSRWGYSLSSLQNIPVFELVSDRVTDFFESNFDQSLWEITQFK